MNKIKFKNSANKENSWAIKKVTTTISLLVFWTMLTSCGNINEINANLGIPYNDCIWRKITPWKPIHWISGCIHCHKPCPIKIK